MRMRHYAPSISRSWFVFELSALLLLGGCLIQPKDADCEGATNCGDCLDRSGCGWCAPRGRCVAGSSAGPTDEFLDCESDVEFITSGWRYSSCTSCAEHTTCGDCHDDYCTWCADGVGYCVNGSDDDACGNPRGRTDGCGGFPSPDMGPGGPGPGGCTNTCTYAGDGECDDGGPGSDFSVCDYGTDCTDCGPRS